MTVPQQQALRHNLLEQVEVAVTESQPQIPHQTARLAALFLLPPMRLAPLERFQVVPEATETEMLLGVYRALAAEAAPEMLLQTDRVVLAETAVSAVAEAEVEVALQTEQEHRVREETVDLALLSYTRSFNI
jgi:hypothetical protein